MPSFAAASFAVMPLQIAKATCNSRFVKLAARSAGKATCGSTSMPLDLSLPCSCDLQFRKSAGTMQLMIAAKKNKGLWRRRDVAMVGVRAAQRAMRDGTLRKVVAEVFSSSMPKSWQEMRQPVRSTRELRGRIRR